MSCAKSVRSVSFVLPVMVLQEAICIDRSSQRKNLFKILVILKFKLFLIDLAMLVTSGKYPHLRLRGFMTMAPKCDSDEIYRMHFANVRAVSEDIWSRLPYAQENMILSMGMSESFVPATMEGATLVRVGRSLFHKPDTETP